jgi:hypothetical protein
MATGLRVEDRLDGATNFISWKERIVFLLQECELWDIVLTKITHMRDEIGVVGEVVADNEIVRNALNGVTKQWVVFVEGLVERENIPKWDRLWDEFI